MSHWKIKLSLFLNYFVFAILLNSVGTVILQVQSNYGVTESAASVLEAFKDLSIAVVSFFVASYITRIGYKNAMLIALALCHDQGFVCRSGNFVCTYQSLSLRHTGYCNRKQKRACQPNELHRIVFHDWYSHRLFHIQRVCR